MNKYIGITLGPIHDAMMLATRPAGLWAASYIFSGMARDICGKLAAGGVKQEQFVVPYFKLTDGNVTLPAETGIDFMALMNKGLGFFHDRIIFQADQEKSDAENMAVVQCAVREVIRHYCDMLLDAVPLQDRQAQKETLQRFFQIYFLLREVPKQQSPVLYLSDALNQLECQSRFSVITDYDILFDLFDHNQYIKELSFVGEMGSSFQMLTEGGKVKDIPDIAAAMACPAEADRKKYRYFAVVQADGDCMGKTLGYLKEREQIREYSRKCLTYTAKCSERILDYGGVVIYAGGDDLLFLAPIESDLPSGKKNIIELAHELKDIFGACDFGSLAEEVSVKPALSVGISIQYKKFPLYEALRKAEEMLFAVAKQKRDSLAVHVNKASGRSMQFVIRGFSGSPLPEKAADLANQGAESRFLSSVIQHIGDFRTVFEIAMKKAWNSGEYHWISNAFLNTFDANVHREQPEMLKQYELLMEEIVCNRQLELCYDNTVKEAGEEEALMAYIELLRYIRLFSEKAGEME